MTSVVNKAKARVRHLEIENAGLRQQLANAEKTVARVKREAARVDEEKEEEALAMAKDFHFATAAELTDRIVDAMLVLTGRGRVE